MAGKEAPSKDYEVVYKTLLAEQRLDEKRFEPPAAWRFVASLWECQGRYGDGGAADQEIESKLVFTADRILKTFNAGLQQVSKQSTIMNYLTRL